MNKRKNKCYCILDDIRKIINNEDLCAEAMVAEIGEIIGE